MFVIHKIVDDVRCINHGSQIIFGEDNLHGIIGFNFYDIFGLYRCALNLVLLHSAFCLVWERGPYEVAANILKCEMIHCN